MDRIIEVKVGGNYLSKDSKNAGVKGEANVTKLRITFDEGWDGYTKKITFWNARGLNPVVITLLPGLAENKTTYLVPIPAEPLEEAGMLTFVIEGTVEDKVQRSLSDKLEVKDAPFAQNAGQPVPPTEDELTQLEGELEKIKGDILEVRNVKEDAKKSAESAETGAKSAESSASDAEEQANQAKEYAGDAEEAANKAQTAVGKTSYIGENGNWYAWDSSTDAFYDTGVKAQAGSTVYLGDNPPPEADVWIDPDGDVDEEEAEDGSITADGSRDAVLLAMYNEVIEPSSKDWFVVDESDPSIIVGFNLDDYGDTLWEEDEIIFPYEINGVPIRKIHFSYFDCQLSATRMRFPNCITEIRTEGTCFGLFAYNVESINIPTSCEYLSELCFDQMVALKEVISPIKPNWELVMGSGCFSDCYSLNNIDTIIDGIKEIPDAAFYHCGGVKNVVIPESVEKIGGEALAFVNDGSFNCITILNADCDLSHEGFIFSNEEYYPKVIKGYTGSTAEELANKIGVTFVSLDGAEFDSIDETLDRIIAIQESLIGGDSV